MWIDTAQGRELVSQLSMNVVTEVAPEELPIFHELMREYIEHPEPPEPSDSARDDPLGFGLSEALVAVTPAAAAMVSAVISQVLSEAMRTAQEEGAEAIKRRISGLFRPAREGEGPPPLTKDRLKQINRLARKKAEEFGMEPDLAKRMADALIGSLAMSK